MFLFSYLCPLICGSREAAGDTFQLYCRGANHPIHSTAAVAQHECRVGELLEYPATLLALEVIK